VLQERPLCKCHKLPMWRNKSVGGWRCQVSTERRNRLSELRGLRKKVLRQLQDLRKELT